MDGLSPCLETSLYPTPTPRARGLDDEDRKTQVSEFLFDTIGNIIFDGNRR